MKVLFIASYFPKPDNTVMGTWALTQAQALARQGINLKVVSFTSWVPKSVAITPGAKAYAYAPSAYTWPGPIHVLYPRWLYYPIQPLKQPAYVNPLPFLKCAEQSARRRLMKIIDRFQPDLFFCHHSLPNGWLAAQLPLHHRRPLITLEHDFEEISDCRIYSKRKIAMAQVVKQTDLLLAVSNRMAQNMRLLFPSTSIKTLHNGIDIPPASLADQPRPTEIQGKKVVLVCALFAERKGIPLLINAFSQISKKLPTAILRIIGSGPEEEIIRQTIQTLNLTNRVQMTGKKTHSQVLQEMAWADCFALVGWNEPFATVYLEAMAAGKPIIYCDDGGINDVVKSGVHGYAVPPKDENAVAEALSQVLIEDDRRLAMGVNARKLIDRQLTWDAKAAQLLQLFQYVLETKLSSQSSFSPSTASTK